MRYFWILLLTPAVGCWGQGTFTSTAPPPAPDARSTPTPYDAPLTERCNGRDDDSDDVVDEGCACSYLDRPGEVCTSRISQDGHCIRPPDFESPEQSCDNLDNDCDGRVDEPPACEIRPCWLDPKLCKILRLRPNGPHLELAFKCADQPEKYWSIDPSLWSPDQTQPQCYKVQCIRHPDAHQILCRP